MMVTANRAAPDETGEILADIQAEAVLATQIIERHRTMLRSHQLHKKPIDLHSVIDESLALVAHDMRARQIEATLDLSSTPCVIDGDQVLLEQVLVNLIRNAMDALAETPPARRHITIRSAVTAADVEVSVCDTGTGLPAEIIGTLFTPFVTTKSHGLGIGLAIAQRIVDAHGGTISCPRESRRRGDIHCHAAPQRNAQPPLRTAERSKSAPYAPIAMPSRLRVLIVDDHPGLVRAVCRLLGCDYDVVGSVADASALLEAAHDLEPDVIVLDLNLPNVDGLKACRQITQANPKMKVIVFTAGDDPDIRRRAFEAGASAFVDKLAHDGGPAIGRQAPGRQPRLIQSRRRCTRGSRNAQNVACGICCCVNTK